MRRLFPRELLESWGLPWSVQGEEPLSDEEWDTGRWHEHHAVVFRAPDDNRLWRVIYAKGLTEIQEMQPWDDEDSNVNTDGTVDGVEVEPREVTITEYTPVKD